MNKSKKFLLIPAAIVCTLIATARPALAHHSFAAEFDGRKLVAFTGTFYKLEWTNPHAHFYITVKEQNGSTAVWNFELASPNVLMRHGWTRDAVKAGDTVTVVAYLAKDGSKLANAQSVTLPDGRNIFARSSGESGPTP
jgi:hypothetical protein